MDRIRVVKLMGLALMMVCVLLSFKTSFLDPYSFIPAKPDVRQIVDEIKPYSYEICEPSARQIVGIVISHHPNRQVRALGDLLSGRKMVFNFFNFAFAAAFVVMPYKAVDEEYRKAGRQPYYPALSVNPFLIYRGKENDILIMMVVLEHEFIHFQQWQRAGKSGIESYKTLWARGEDAKKTLPPESCRRIWEMEKEAYWRSCQLFNAWNIKLGPAVNVCRYESEKDFGRRLLEYFVEEEYSGLTECFNVWQEEVEIQRKEGRKK